MKKPAARQLALFGALGLSLAATAWVARDEAPEPIAPAPRRSAATASTQPDWPGPAASARTAWQPLDNAVSGAWGEAAAAPASAQAEPPPEPPHAPPFPYQFVGRMTDSRPRVVLNNVQRSAVVAVGEVVDGQWRVDAIEPGGLRLTYLPLGLAQFVPFASSTKPSA